MRKEELKEHQPILSMALLGYASLSFDEEERLSKAKSPLYAEPPIRNILPSAFHLIVERIKNFTILVVQFSQQQSLIRFTFDHVYV